MDSQQPLLSHLSADERFEEKRDCGARISHDGVVEWYPMAIYKSTCPVKIRYFPYDKQVCNLRFGPWTHDNARVNITRYQALNMDLENYMQSPEWVLEDTHVQIRERSYPCCPEKYYDMLFHIRIKRQPAYYNYLLILPCFLLSSLTLVLFWLPPETPAKMVLGMNIFLAIFLLLLLLEDSIPSASSSFPLIGNYYCINMTLVTLSTFLCLIVVNLHFRGDRKAEVPHWLRKLVIQHGARLLLVSLGPPGGSAKKPTSGEKDSPLRLPYPKSNIPFYGAPFMYPYNMNQNPANLEQVYPPMGQSANYDPAALMNMYSSTHYPDYMAYPTRVDDNHIVTLDPGREAASLKYQNYTANTTTMEEETKQCAFCPACAGLAAANAASTSASEDACSPESPNYQLQQQQTNLAGDPTDELAAVWATAMTGERSNLDQRVGQHWSETPQDQQLVNLELQKSRLQCKPMGFATDSRLPWSNLDRNEMSSEPGRLLPSSQFYPLVSPNCQDEDTDDEDNEDDDESESDDEDDGDDEESNDNDSPGKHRVGFTVNAANRENIRLWSKSHRRAEDFPIAPNYFQGPRDESQMPVKNQCVRCSAAKEPFNEEKNSNSIDPKLVKRIQRIRADILEIVKGIRFMQRRNKNKEKHNKIITEWRAVGMVLDRLFFVIYIFALAISIICYFPRPGDDESWPPEE